MSSEPQLEVRAALAALRIERAGDRIAAPVRSPRFPRKIAVAIALAIAMGCAAWLVGTAARPQTIHVEVAYASRSGDDPAPGPILSGAGYVVTGDRYISLGARVPGRVARYLVEEGERVVAGQPLVHLDDRHYAAAVREAEAGRRIAEANARLRSAELARLRQLHDRNTAPRAALDAKENEQLSAAAEVERLTARLAQLRLDLEETVVRAPTGGVVLEKLKAVGEMAVPGGFSGSGELIRIANLDELRAEIDVNEGDLAKIELGQRSEIVPDAFPSRRYPAEVVKLYPQMNRQKGTLRVEVRIGSPDDLLRPDMSVRVHFHAGEQPATPEPHVRAPRDAIRQDAAGHYVWTVQGERVTRRDVELGPATDGGLVQVRAGLEGGEALVLGPMAGLDETSTVEIANRR